MKSLFISFLITVASLCNIPDANCVYDYDDYKNWSHEDVIALYVEISEDEAKRNGFDESYSSYPEVRYFKKCKVSSGLYEVEVYDKIDSKFWSIRYTSPKIFMKFRYNPFLFKFDEGLLDWDGSDGVFYQKP